MGFAPRPPSSSKPSVDAGRQSAERSTPMSKLTLRLEAYDRDAKQVVSAAQDLADDRRHEEVMPLHLLHQLVEGSSEIGDALGRCGVDPTDVVVEGELHLRKQRTGKAKSYLAPATLELLGRAEGEAAREGGSPVGVAHLMLACAQESDGPVKDIFRRVGLSAPILRAALGGGESSEGEPRKTPGATPKKRRGALPSDPIAAYGRDLTAMAKEDAFDPTVGRDGELRRVLQVLARRRENNPLLVGEPGIGKTSIVQALAQRMAIGDVPGFLKDRRIVALEMGALVAGASLRGQLEERVRAFLDAVQKSAGGVVLFLPDLGALTGKAAGAGELIGSALARGEVRAIAVATPDAMRKAQDEDSQLVRRFVGIPVEPPTIDEAVGVLRGVVERFEANHGIRISDPALVAAVNFARRYVTGVQLPKSAVDLIDEAAARVRVELDSEPAELDMLRRRLETLEIQLRSLRDDHDAESREAAAKLEEEAAALRPKVEEMRQRWERESQGSGEQRRLKEELAEAQAELEKVRSTDHARAGELRFGTIPMLEEKLAALGPEESAEPAEQMVHDVVLPQDVADVVAAWTGVPVSKMMEEETTKLLRMEDELKNRVIGQDHAVTALSKAVRRGRVGLRDPRKPIGSFLFLGPTGVGKTELAKALAEFLFDDEAALTRLDMSEFMEKHMVARLLGAPPGYKDSDAGGFLTEAVRQRPYSVILFDEMEKAHPDVFNICLQVLDDGRLTDSKGRLATFADTVIIMTSNVGSHLILDHEGSEDELREKIEEELHEFYRPEFLNRLTKHVIFNPLSKDDLIGIAAIQLGKLEKLLTHRRIGLEVTDAARQELVERGYEPAFGARPLNRAILHELQDPMAEEMLRGGYQAGDTIRVDFEEGDFTFGKISSGD